MTYDKALYKEFETAPIPNDIPELGVKAGTMAMRTATSLLPVTATNTEETS